MNPKTLLLTGLVLIGLGYLAFWAAMVRSQRAARSDSSPLAPSALQAGIGFVTNFFDTLGIGSYATSTAMFRLWKVVPDERIPGTLNVGHALPTIIQALIYITIVDVDFATLVAIIGAAVAGAWLGAGVVSRLPRRQVQIGMGFALVAAAGLILAQVLGVGPAPGVALGVTGTKLAIAVGSSVVLGALMMLGIGFYAPCLIMISLLGMSPTAAFPIMMGSCAFLMPVGSLQFIRRQSYDLRTAIGLVVGGPLAVLIAAYIVKQLPLTAVRWLVVFVVLYTAAGMLRAAAYERALKLATAPQA